MKEEIAQIQVKDNASKVKMTEVEKAAEEKHI